MAFTFTGTPQRKNEGMFETYGSPSVSTSTTSRALSNTTTATNFSLLNDVLSFTGPTATIANWFTLADANEGQGIWLVYNASGAGGVTATTGDVHIIPSNTATYLSSITFRSAGQYWHGKFMNGVWHALDRTTQESAIVAVGSSTATTNLSLAVDNILFTGGTATQGLRLANGYEGQVLWLKANALGGTATIVITPDNMHKFTSVNLASGTYAELQFRFGEWVVTSALDFSPTATNGLPIVT